MRCIPLLFLVQIVFASHGKKYEDVFFTFFLFLPYIHMEWEE